MEWAVLRFTPKDFVLSQFKKSNPQIESELEQLQETHAHQPARRTLYSDPHHMQGAAFGTRALRSIKNCPCSEKT